MAGFKLKRPCANCPFRTDVPGYLRRERCIEIAHSIADGAPFPCHQTTEAVEDYDGEGDSLVATEDSQFCAGALILMEKIETPNQIVRIAERLDMYDAGRLDMDAPVHRSFVEFINHHGDATGAPEPETCHVVNGGCLAPAGMLVGGAVVLVEAEGEVHECPACGEPVCDACSYEGVCFYCAGEPE